MNRWLYDRAASDYEKKWASAAYDNAAIHGEVQAFASASLAGSKTHRVLDLGCGTGRGVRLLADELPSDTEFLGVDFSAGMLQRFSEWRALQDKELQNRITLLQQDIRTYAADPGADAFGLVLLLEVGEFLPGFSTAMQNVATRIAPAGGLIMTRPAGAWPLFFPSRKQSRSGLVSLLANLGFESPRFLPWRPRYELVFAVKRSGPN
ncbi:MAG TPA: class I SAM-dependent methyltransferase [Woeseiaceae bacterium]|nr:class I SAM-dependent methyltransferase [Woeseiaceae bacterium]